MPRDRRNAERVTVYRAEIPGPPPEEWNREYESVSDALHFACLDLRSGRRTPLEITEDGMVVYDAAAIAAACEEREHAHDDDPG
jgi:hypothetical protein